MSLGKMIRLSVPLRRMSTINRLCCCVENENNLPGQERDSYFGIQENVGNHLKLNGLMKHKSSHFHVNEIGSDGEIVHLTDLSPPPKSVMAPDEPFYTHCTLYKKGFAHSDVLDKLVTKLRIQTCDIGTAGVKDKWGITTQKMSIRNVDPAALVALFQKHRHVKFGNFTYEKHPFAPGDLIGNHFRILLLDVKNATGSSSVTDDIHNAVTSLKDFGFINYYGSQRFGRRSHIIGKTMLQMNWEQVFDLILSSSQKCQPGYISAAKKLWFSVRDPHEIAKHLPRDVDHGSHGKSMEIWLLEGLAKHYNGGRGNLIEAYKTIPQYMRLFHYAGFKSYLWNHLVSFRIRTFGLKPIPGDMVNLKTITKVEGITFSANIEPLVPEDGGSYSDHEVRVLTNSDFDSNGYCRNYSIYDVVLASPGSKMAKYANPEVQHYFEKILKINQLELGCFAKFVEKFEDGSDPVNRTPVFRHVVQKPMNLTYKIVRYNRQQDLNHLISSDLEVLQANEHYLRRENKPTTNDWEQNNKEKICVSLEFSLLKGTYATIALRELLTSTSTWK